MSTKSYYAGGLGSSGPQLNFTDDLLSPAKGTSLWQSCPLLAIMEDPTVGHIHFDDFHQLTKAADNWILTAATTGTAVAGVLAGGVATLDAGAITDGQGPQIQSAGVDFIPAAGKDLWFETRLKVSHVSGDFFFGLTALDTTLVATSALTISDGIGFESFTGDGVLVASSEKATVRGTVAAVKTLVAATYVKLGFVVRGVTDVTFYVDGVANATLLLTANIPVLALTPGFTVHATGTDQAVLDIDWVKVVQLR
jgi:hypothetical protein